MSKYVYLFELDSVRKTDEEIIAGQAALYDEIVTNGNIVVLTYNQMVDSRGFFSLLKNGEYKEALLKLFDSGVIKISQYGDIRTVSQYLMDSIEDDKQFIYSALPLKYSQKRLTAIMKRCLLYSDLSEIYEYGQLALALKRNENGEQYNDDYKNRRDELIDIFVEVDKDGEHQTNLSWDAMAEILENLYSFMETVIKLSMMHDIYISPRADGELGCWKFSSILDKVIRLYVPKDNVELWGSAQTILDNIYKQNKNENNRSVYIRKLKKLVETGTNVKGCQYAQAIVDLCYNYACESSISNVSRHYDVMDLEDWGSACHGENTFECDFSKRLKRTWDGGRKRDERYLVDEKNDFKTFKLGKYRPPKIVNAARIVGYVKDKPEIDRNYVFYYENNAKKDKHRRKLKLLCGILKKIVFAILCFLIVISPELTGDYWTAKAMQNSWIKPAVAFWNSVPSGIQTMVMLIITEIVTSLIAKIPGLDALSLSESLAEIWQLLRDMVRITFRKSKAYVNSVMKGLDSSEHFCEGEKIRYTLTKELKRYLKLCEDRNITNEDSEYKSYPIASLDTLEARKQILRDEELHSRKYGVVYSSAYNMMVVDPIRKDDNELMAYERVLPNGNDGVVILAKHKGKYVLLEQFRHAIRRRQYACPRGFSDPNCTPIEDVRREIREELGADIIGKPIELGRIAADSGLTGGCVHVFLTNIGAYKQRCGHEGIISTIELTRKQMEIWVSKKRIDDGFTLGALELERCWRLKRRRARAEL